MARNAVRLTPLCADALNILAELSSSPQEALLYYERALHAAEFALAPKTLTDYAGGFWVYIETRPYMTALLGFATALSDLDKTGEAIECCRRLLALNSRDHQGVRHLLLALLMRRNDLAGATRLLQDYPDDRSASQLYTEALIAFRKSEGADQKARIAAREAYVENAHVPKMLASRNEPPAPAGGTVIPGSPDEAARYVRSMGKVWRGTQGAVAWLMDIVGSGWN